jgi:hypothetical protein
MRTTAMVALTLLLAVVFSVGLFAGWVYGTRNTGTGIVPPTSSPAASVPPVTVTGSSLDEVRAAVVVKVRPTVVQVNVTLGEASAP